MEASFIILLFINTEELVHMDGTDYFCYQDDNKRYGSCGWYKAMFLSIYVYAIH